MGLEWVRICDSYPFFWNHVSVCYIITHILHIFAENMSAMLIIVIKTTQNVYITG